jgi:hypothetical protein
MENPLSECFLIAAASLDERCGLKMQLDFDTIKREQGGPYEA